MIEAVNYSAVKPSQAQLKKMQASLVSWRTVHPIIKDLPDSNESLKELAYMVACEMKNPDGPRMQILTRLHMRINAMRQRMEMSQLSMIAER